MILICLRGGDDILDNYNYVQCCTCKLYGISDDDAYCCLDDDGEESCCVSYYYYQTWCE